MQQRTARCRHPGRAGAAGAAGRGGAAGIAGVAGAGGVGRGRVGRRRCGGGGAGGAGGAARRPARAVPSARGRAVPAARARARAARARRAGVAAALPAGAAARAAQRHGRRATDRHGGARHDAGQGQHGRPPPDVRGLGDQPLLVGEPRRRLERDGPRRGRRRRRRSGDRPRLQHLSLQHRRRREPRARSHGAVARDARLRAVGRHLGLDRRREPARGPAADRRRARPARSWRRSRTRRPTG